MLDLADGRSGGDAVTGARQVPAAELAKVGVAPRLPEQDEAQAVLVYMRLADDTRRVDEQVRCLAAPSSCWFFLWLLLPPVGAARTEMFEPTMAKCRWRQEWGGRRGWIRPRRHVRCGDEVDDVEYGDASGEMIWARKSGD